MSVIAALYLAAALGGQSVSIDDPQVQRELRHALVNYATCLVDRKGAAVEALLARPYDDRVSKASRELHDPECPVATADTTFNQRIVRNFDGLPFRAVLFQVLAVRDLSPTSIPVTIADLGDGAFPIGRMWPGSPAAEYLSYIGMGRCLLTRNVEKARQLVLSDMGSPEERVAFDALRPILPRCRWTRPDISIVRGSLSEIVYRSSRAGNPAVFTSTDGNR